MAFGVCLPPLPVASDGNGVTVFRQMNLHEIQLRVFYGFEAGRPREEGYHQLKEVISITESYPFAEKVGFFD